MSHPVIYPNMLTSFSFLHTCFTTNPPPPCRSLKNISLNLLGKDLDDLDRAAIDWQPPTAFGLDNSLRLADAAAAAGVGTHLYIYTSLMPLYVDI